MKHKLRVADLYSGAGGAAMGYYQAGFEVIGFDIEPQPNYPFEFYKIDVLDIDPEWLAEEFDLIHASPPCQEYSVTNHVHKVPHPRLIRPTRKVIKEAGLPYVIENVEGAINDLISPIKLCGSSFYLRVRRHRYFESSLLIKELRCNHTWQNRSPIYEIYTTKSRTNGVGYRLSGTVPVHGGNHIVGGGQHYHASVAMGIDWMNHDELNEAIPPAYTRFIGKQIIKQLCP